MKTVITSRHESLTEGLRVHIEQKIHRVERYLGKIREAHVVLNFEKKTHFCEINLAAKSVQLTAKASSRDMYASIDAALARLETQAQKRKEKRITKHRVAESAGIRSVTHGVIRSSAEGEDLQVVQSRKYAVKPMTVEEAALQLSGNKDEFLVFSNAETGRTSVVYKRKDQRVGLIEPEF
jgi:putative sigma-54 modulation protein